MLEVDSEEINKLKIKEGVQTISQIFSQAKHIISKTLNQTLSNISEKNIDNLSNYTKKLNYLNEQSQQNSWSIFFFIKIIFYIFIIIKVLQYFLQKRQKTDIKERVYRKYLFAHSQMIRQFSEQDIKLMNITLINTQKNACTKKIKNKTVKENKYKKVKFQQNNNEYFEPRNNDDQISSQYKLKQLMMFLNSAQNHHRNQFISVQKQKQQFEPEKMRREEEPNYSQFTQIQTISQTDPIQVNQQIPLLNQSLKEVNSASQ